MPPSRSPGRLRDGELALDVQKRGAWDVALEVELTAALGLSQLPAAVDELVPHGPRRPSLSPGKARLRAALTPLAATLRVHRTSVLPRTRSVVLAPLVCLLCQRRPRDVRTRTPRSLGRAEPVDRPLVRDEV